MNHQEALINICRKKDYHIDLVEYGLNNFDKFPYIPYIPEQWNGILVLAESQQLRGNDKGNLEYLERIKKASEIDQITRLGNRKIAPEGPEKLVGIWPWDNGLIKFALLAALPNERIENFALSNSIPWHLDKNNPKQLKFLKDKSCMFWQDVLNIIRPKTIICTGEIAETIISKTNYCNDDNACMQYNLRSASQLHWVAKKDFNIQHYPELVDIFDENIGFINPKLPMRYYIYYMAQARIKLIK